MAYWCDEGKTLLYPQPFLPFLCSYIYGYTFSARYLVQFTTPLTHLVQRFFFLSSLITTLHPVGVSGVLFKS